MPVSLWKSITGQTSQRYGDRAPDLYLPPAERRARDILARNTDTGHWQQDGSWSWSNFGARKPLRGGPGSVAGLPDDTRADAASTTSRISGYRLEPASQAASTLVERPGLSARRLSASGASVRSYDSRSLYSESSSVWSRQQDGADAGSLSPRKPKKSLKKKKSASSWNPSAPSRKYADAAAAGSSLPPTRPASITSSHHSAAPDPSYTDSRAVEEQAPSSYDASIDASRDDAARDKSAGKKAARLRMTSIVEDQEEDARPSSRRDHPAPPPEHDLASDRSRSPAPLASATQRKLSSFGSMPLNSQLRPEEEAPRQRKGADRHRKPKLALATSADGLSESMNPTPPNVDYSDSEHSRHSSVDGRLFDSLPTSTATTPSRGDPRASSPQRPKSSLLSERSDSPARAQMAASAAQADISAAEPAARAESSAHVPGITLTRSESDQVRLGVRGDVRLATEQQGVIEEEVADVSPSVTEPPAVERPAESATAASPQLKTTPPRDTAPSSVTPSSIEPASRPTSVKKKKKSKTGEETSSKKKSKKKSEGAADDGESVKSASSSKKKVKRSKSSKTLANPTLVEDAQQPGATLEIISPSRPAKSSSLTRSASMGAASPHVLSQSKGSARSSTSPMRTSASVASIASAPSVAPSTAPPPLPVFEIPKAPPSQNPDKPKSGLSRSLSSLSPKKKRNSVLGLADDVSRAAQHDRSASSPLASPATSRPASPSPSLPARPKAKPAAQPLARSPSLIQASPRPAQAKAKPAAPRPASLVSPSPSGTSISTSPGSSPVVRPQPVPRQQAVRPVSVASLPTATQGVASTSQGSSAHTSPATSVKGVVVGAAALGTGTADSSIFGRLNATEADRRRTRSDVGRPMSMMSLPAQSVAMPDSLLPDGGLNAGGTIRPRAMSLLNEPVAHSSHSAPPRELPTAADFRPTNDVRNVVMMGSTRLEKANLTCMRALILASSTSAALRRRSPLASVFGRSAPHVEAFRYDRDLEFSPRQSLPSQLKPNEALIGVLAGAIDEHDMAWTSRMSTIAQGFGWIPGRSFCGKVVEAGFEVSKVKRGDFVYGYTELDKSGALSEMVVANSDNLALAPTSGISVEQIATLPAPGVYACQIMESICSDLPKGSKVLVLSAHEGVGNLCQQLAFHFRHTRDLWMVAQCPPDVVDGEDFCRATGASDVIVDEPLAALNSVHESSFDVVIDTIGGRRLYDAARRVLHYNATYITCVGDELIPNPSASDHWKVGVRSLRRAFVKKDKKVINYWSINFDQRELPRESLDKLRAAVDAGLVRPVVRRVLQLPEAAAAFEPGTGGNKVVRIADTI